MVVFLRNGVSVDKVMVIGVDTQDKRLYLRQGWGVLIITNTIESVVNGSDSKFDVEFELFM